MVRKKTSGLVKDYLSFSRSEKRGIIALLGVLILLIAAPRFLPFFISSPPTDFTSFRQQIAALRLADTLAGNEENEEPYPAVSSMQANASAALFSFDPNKLPGDKWKQLGLS